MNENSALSALIGGVASNAIMGCLMGYLLGFKQKGQTMTSMEKAFVALVEVLCGRLREQDEELTKLRKDNVELMAVRQERDRLQVRLDERERELHASKRRGDDLFDKVSQMTKKRRPRPGSGASGHGI